MFELMPVARAMMNPFYDVDRMTRSFFGEDQLRAFRTDIRETENGYCLEAELPGFSKEDIQIEVSGDQLTIQAQRNGENEQKDDQGNYLRRERYFGAYSRSFDVSGIDQEGISASYQDGVLRLELPRRAVEAPKSRRLEIQ